jgi:hypothetical protein
MPRYEDFDSNNIEALEKRVKEIIDEEGEVYTYNLANEKLDHENWGWTFDSFRMALTAIRQKLEDEGEIRVEVEDTDKVNRKKKWVPTEQFNIEDD